MRPQRSYGTRTLSSTKARAALAALLRDCRPEMLPTFTAEGLARSYRVPVATAAEMLAGARAARQQRRSG